MDQKPTSHGIEELIARLHGEGVESGRREADRILDEARAAAKEIVARARAEADALKEEARGAAAAEREAARHALVLAHRDAVLTLKEDLCIHLAGRLRRLVAREVADPEVLRRALLAALGKGENVHDQDLDRVLAEATKSLLTDGDGFRFPVGGVCIRLRGEDVGVDVSDEALAELLATHLMPRFLARLNGAAGA
jgi:V/A-type H+-transporting ATPase subunit E